MMTILISKDVSSVDDLITSIKKVTGKDTPIKLNKVEVSYQIFQRLQSKTPNDERLENIIINNDLLSREVYLRAG